MEKSQNVGTKSAFTPKKKKKKRKKESWNVLEFGGNGRLQKRKEV